MKSTHFILIAITCLLLILSSCTGKSSVNILIMNEGKVTVKDKTVEVPVVEVRQWLEVSDTDSLFLYNEKNEPVAYHYNDDRTAITFLLPIAQENSQKNYTINAGDPGLLDNLFSFRQQKIRVSVK
jgi:hypothetical protein